MSKTIIESMYMITEKMRDNDNHGSIIVTPATCKKAEPELRYLRKTFGMTTMQVLILTAIIQKSARYRIDGDDIASFLGMEYLKFLTHDSDLEYLKKKGYIRMDKELHINVPKEVMRALKGNKPVEPEPTTGLTTGKILTRMKKLLAIRDDDEMDSDDLNDEVIALFEDNPDTSIAKAFKKYIGKYSNFLSAENIFFYVLICRYWFDNDDMVGWHNVDDYLDEEELDDLRTDSRTESLYLQRKKIIEFTGYDGMLTKDYFKIKDEIKEEIFADVGGIRKEAPKVSASRKLNASGIVPKELFYNMDEGRQVARLKELMSEKRFGEIREKMKAKGLRTGFTCLFYGSPGTGKTETVYQIARECGRDLFIVDVSQVKSCWVGESEKNIKDVFDKYRQAVRAEGPVPILLFNEADAIFSVRIDAVRQAADQMENAIQNIILQEMEDLDGILIATTNLTTNLDKAFERRFLYKIRFDKPSLEAKVSIWRSMIPSLSETEAVHLATDFDFSGGQIENIARKREVQSIIGLCDPDFAQVREFCTEETIGNESRRRIGF
jgi:SpoVK/Ycf46/Vps4 family AAA+-type ATPase